MFQNMGSSARWDTGSAQHTQLGHLVVQTVQTKSSWLSSRNLLFVSAALISTKAPLPAPLPFVSLCVKFSSQPERVRRYGYAVMP